MKVKLKNKITSKELWRVGLDKEIFEEIPSGTLEVDDITKGTHISYYRVNGLPYFLPSGWFDVVEED